MKGPGLVLVVGKTVIEREIVTWRVAVARERRDVCDAAGVVSVRGRVHSFVDRCAGGWIGEVLVDGDWKESKAVRERWRSRVPLAWRALGRRGEAVSVCAYAGREDVSV